MNYSSFKWTKPSKRCQANTQFSKIWIITSFCFWFLKKMVSDASKIKKKYPKKSTMGIVNWLGRSACNRNERFPLVKISWTVTTANSNSSVAAQKLTSCERQITGRVQLFSLTSSSRTFKHNTTSKLAVTNVSNSAHQFTPANALPRNQARCTRGCTLQP